MTETDSEIVPELPRSPKAGNIAGAQVVLEGLSFAAWTMRECVGHILDEVQAGRGGWCVTPNLAILHRCRKDRTVYDLVRKADLIVPDGVPVVLASRLQGTPLPQRIAGPDLMSHLCAAAAERGVSVYLLGGLPGIADRTAEVLKQRHSRLRIAGTYCPPFGFEKDPLMVERIVGAVRSARPGIVFVALTFPKGEFLIQRIRSVQPAAWCVGVGMSFSFLCGAVKRAPKSIQRLGLEWLHRLVQEPRRLAKRYLVQGIPFAGSLLAGAAVRRVRRARAGPE